MGHNFPTLYLIFVLILCSIKCPARRLTASVSHPWTPIIHNSDKSQTLSAYQAHNSYPQDSQNSEEETLAARVFADEDERPSKGQDVTGKSERTYGGIYKPVPYQAGIIYKGQFRCGAALVEEKNVKFFLTAASCVTQELQNSIRPDRPHFFEFFVGATDIRDVDPSLKHTPVKIRIHPCYNPETKIGNIAVVFVKDDIPEIEGKVKPAKLPLEEGYPFPIDVTISGYGDKHRGSEEFGVLNILTIGAWDWTFCRDFHWQPGMFCIVDMQPTRPRGVCQYDQGGPAVGEYYEDEEDEDFEYLAGIISHVPHGLACQEKGVPAMITQTSLYLPWILDEVNERNNAPWQKECVPVNCQHTEC